MSEPDAKQGWRATLWGYNLRILLTNSYWLVVTPVVATQLVLFWNMATSTLPSASRAAQTVELLAPILGAFLCAHALAPEQDGVGELVFVRPVSLEKILALRVAMIFGFVLALLVPAFVIYVITIPGFPLGLVLLAAVPGTLFLSALAMAVAAATRQPLLGLGAAGAFWALDFATGGYYHPLLSLHRFADYLVDRPMSEQWLTSKLLLFLMAVACYLWSRRVLGRPAAPRRWSAAWRAAAMLALVAAVYLISGAGYKVVYGLQHERELGPKALLWYQTEFRGYGALPIARVFGPAFALYVGAEGGGEEGPARGQPRGGLGLWAGPQVSRMKELVRRYPRSLWADNAQLEIALQAGRRETERPWVVLSRRAGGAGGHRVIREDLEGMRAELEKLVRDYPESPFAALALARLGQIATATLDFEQARAAYQRIVSEHPSAPEAYEAGMGLAACYLAEHRAKQALEAAVVAARVAQWDVEAEAWLVAAQAAEMAGQGELARRYYQRARDRVREARERAIRGEKSPSRLAKHEQFHRYDQIERACEQGLSRRAAPPRPERVRLAELRGEVALPSGAGPARVALGTGVDPEGFPSPFVGGVAASAPLDQRGRFVIRGLPAGSYSAFAISFRAPQASVDLQLAGPPLPLRVEGGRLMVTAAAVGPFPRGIAGPVRQEESQRSAAAPSGRAPSPPRPIGRGPQRRGARAGRQELRRGL